MISNEKIVNYKIVVLIKIYNFGFGWYSIRGRLNNFVFKNFKTSDTNLWL
jgi:hypothetical protein